jgi:RecA/RadA recombinase
VADHDDSGTGQREAEKAAEAIGGRWVMPPTPGDANDYAQAGGDLAALLEPVEQPQHRYKLVPAHQLTNLPAIKWQIKKILPARDVCAIYGAPGAGKSFMALDMAAAIAEGRDWMGYRTKPAIVVYVVLEAANGFSGRLKAWQMHHGRQLPDTLKIITHTPLALSSAKDLQDLIAAIRAVVGDDHGGLVLFIDTLARAMGTYEENSNDDMGRVVAACDLLSKQLECTVAAVAHPGKDVARGMRGGSALLGGLDTVIQLEKDDNGIRTWTIEKQKEGEDGLTGQFKLHVLAIGEDDDGDEITSAVILPLDESEIEGNDMPTKESEAIARSRKLFENAVMAVGRIAYGKPFVSADAWNEHTKTMPFATDDSRRQALSRAKKILVKEGYIQEVRGGYEATEHPAFIGAFIGL